MDRPLKIYVFYCSASLDADELLDGWGEPDGEELKSVGLPCSGKVDILYLIKAFESGADGVVVVTCKEDECRHLEGNLRASKRVGAVDSLLDEIGMGKGRIAIIRAGEGGSGQIMRDIEEFRKQIRSAGKAYA